MRRESSSFAVRGDLSASGRRFAVLVSRYNQEITEALLEGALECLRAYGADEDAVDVFRVPGAWELPQAAARIVDQGRHDAVVTLGCVIRGDTPHFEFISHEAARGLGAVARSASVPVSFGVLTTDTPEQARVRSDPEGVNKGWEAAEAALEMSILFERMAGSE